jgi:hypothetical protein
MTEQTHKQVLSLARVRLASTRGHIIIIEAGIPTTIPAALFLEAAKKGCVDYNPQMIEAFKAAMANATKQPAEGTNPAAKNIDVMQIAKDAVRQVLLAGQKEPELLTSQGLPRLPAVRAAYDMVCGEKHVDTELKITTDLIGTLYLAIQEEAKPAEAPTPRYPAGVPTGDLEGEEVGGDIEGTLSRVAEQE